MSESCARCGFKAATDTSNEQIPPVDFAHLLCSNESPSDPELDHIIMTKARLPQRISILDGEIARAIERLESLKAERTRAAQDLDDATVAFNPVRRLPEDILSHIFIACRPDDVPPGPTDADSLDIRQAPWTLVRVCSRWRLVGNSYPLLWSSVYIDLDNMSLPSKPLRTTFLLGLHLHLSSSTPLSISFRSESHIVPWDYPLLQVLLPSSPRWRSAEFVLKPASLQILSPIRGSLESLRELSMRIIPEVIEEGAGNGTGETTTVEGFDYFEFAPELTILHLWSVGDVLNKFIFPWSQISEYIWKDETGDVPIPQHLDVLRRAIHVESLDLHTGVHLNNATTLRLVTLPELTALSLREEESGGISALLPWLMLPKLDDLYLTNHSAAVFIDTDAACAVSLIERSRCRLTQLTLNMEYLSSDHLLSLLRASPTLTMLSIWDGNCFSDDIATLLVYRPTQTDPPLLPALLRLDLHDLTCDIDILLKIVESRRTYDAAALTRTVGDLRAVDHVQSIQHLEIQTHVALSLTHQSRIATLESPDFSFVMADEDRSVQEQG